MPRSRRLLTVGSSVAASLSGEAALFSRLDSTNRYAVLFRLHTAKKAETRDLKPRARLLRTCLGDQ
jgi:hypothetical protein